MKMPLRTLQPGVIQLSRHAVFIALVLTLCFDGWLLWQGWQQWIDQPLPADRVTANQLRVSETQRQSLITAIVTYQHPAAIPPVPNITFDTGTAN